MEDQDKRTEEQDVEAHGKHGHKFSAAEDAPESEGEGDDFELHSRRGHRAL